MSHIDSSSSSIRNRSKSLDSGKSRAAVQLPITDANLLTRPQRQPPTSLPVEATRGAPPKPSRPLPVPPLNLTAPKTPAVQTGAPLSPPPRIPPPTSPPHTFGRANSTPVPETSSLQSLTRDDKRTLVAKEIQASEESYISQLEKLVTYFVRPIDKIDPSKSSAIFANLEIILQFNKEFLQQIKAKVGDWSPTQTIGGVFMKYAAFLKLYTTYASNYQHALKVLADAKLEPAFANILEEGKKQAGADIEQLLITPIQRVPRYELLLRELLKNTAEDHPDYADLTEALKDMKQIAEHIDVNVKNNQNSERVVQMGLSVRTNILCITRRLLTTLQSLLIPTRRLLRDGFLSCECAFKPKKFPVQFWLFNDILVKNDTPKKKIDPQNPKYHWPVNLVWVRDGRTATLAESDQQTVYSRCIGLVDGPDPSFELIGPDDSYMVYTSSTQEKISWMNDIRAAISEAVQGRQDLDYRCGQFSFKDGSSYNGEWYLGKRHGKGTFTAFGNTYTGSWVNDRRHGQGKMTYFNGAQYEGNWEHDLPHGQGVFKDEHGNTYSGNWNAGKRHGHGTVTYTNGAVLSVTWCDDHINGFGVYSTPSGFRYEGSWSYDQFDGKGVLTTASGKTYNGDWKAGVKHGVGVMTWPDGSVYEGEFKDNKRHGQGRYDRLKVDGTLYIGTFVAGRKEGHGVLTYSDNSRYEGTFRAGERHGQGTFFWTHGIYQKYYGEWFKDKMHGKGVLVFADGSRYEGSFKADLMHGNGVMTLVNGSIIEGKWNEGKLDGNAKLKLPSGQYAATTEKYNVNFNGNTIEFLEEKGTKGRPPTSIFPSPLPIVNVRSSWTSTKR